MSRDNLSIRCTVVEEVGGRQYGELYLPGIPQIGSYLSLPRYRDYYFVIKKVRLNISDGGSLSNIVLEVS
jgi:hypothetical protein